jgi:hypothetical protein
VITFIFTKGVTQNMNTFKRKALASAVLSTLGVAGSAQAIYQDPTNLGQVLVYPYYTVNNDGAGNQFNTFISVVNTTSAVKVVKVRFREGQASAEVLDFNVYLSPNDMWTGAVVPLSTDVTSPGAVISADTSCVDPVQITLSPVPFVNFAYNVASDPLVHTLARTREGYAEIFEMGVLPPGALATAATHVNGVPAGFSSATNNCPALVGVAGETAVNAAIVAPTGGLMGTGTIINVTSGRDTMYNATAFGAWAVGGPVYTGLSLGGGGTNRPNFTDTVPKSSAVISLSAFGTAVPNIYFSTWDDSPTAGLGVAGAKAASATMMHSDVLNEYILDAATASQTDWVLTFPTKSFFVNVATAVVPFTAPLTASGACEVIDLVWFNREEGTASASTGSFSPNPPGAPSNTLCWESTIVSFRNGSSSAAPAAPSLVLGSSNVTAIAVTSTFQNGWAAIHFTGSGASTFGLVSAAAGSTTTPLVSGGVATPGAQTYLGLPVVGFMARTFTNGTLHCGTASCLGNYLGSVSHGYRNIITP